MRNIKSLAGFFLLSFFLLAETTQAQVGVFGGVPLFQDPTPVRYVRLQEYEANAETPNPINITIPVNGIKNYVHYYDQSGSFIPGGRYKLTYLAADRITPVSVPGIGSTEGPFTYSPNARFTNGFQVRPTNSGANGALGIQGIVNASQNINGSEVIAPLYDATVLVFDLQTNLIATGKTNGNGFFSIYYTNGSDKNFVPLGFYYVTIIGQSSNQCYYNSPVVNYFPDDSDPDSSSYYVMNARAVIQIPILNCD